MMKKAKPFVLQMTGKLRTLPAFFAGHPGLDENQNGPPS